MSLISEALTAIHTAFMVDPVTLSIIMLCGLLAMGVTSGLFGYLVGKVSKENSDRWGYYPNVDEITEEMEGLDEWDLLFLIIMAEQRLSGSNELVLIPMPESTKA